MGGLVMAVLLAACSSNAASSTGAGSSAAAKSGSTASKVTTVNIGIAAPVALYALPAIADAAHLWPSNVDVHWTVMTAATDISALATGKIQMLIGAPPQADADAYNSHLPIAWIANFQDPADFQMIVRPGINSLTDLKGKVIAETSPGTTTQYLAEVALAKAGLTPSQYTLDPIGSVPTMVSAFVGGTVQAFVLPSSVVQPLLTEVPGSKMLYDFYTQKVPWIGGGVIGYLPWAKQHSAATVSVLKGLSSALGFLHSHQSAAEPIVSKFAPSKTQAAANLQFKFLVQRTPSQLQPVALSTLESMYKDIRDANGGKGPTSAFAKTMYDNTWVDQLAS